jgi:hypothetical protein
MLKATLLYLEALDLCLAPSVFTKNALPSSVLRKITDGFGFVCHFDLFTQEFDLLLHVLIFTRECLTLFCQLLSYLQLFFLIKHVIVSTLGAHTVLHWTLSSILQWQYSTMLKL